MPRYDMLAAKLLFACFNIWSLWLDILLPQRNALLLYSTMSTVYLRLAHMVQLPAAVKNEAEKIVCLLLYSSGYCLGSSPMQLQKEALAVLFFACLLRFSCCGIRAQGQMSRWTWI